jgi:glycosyltransferase involved in cell wall biosynthesis
LGTFGQFIYDLNCINDSRQRDFDILLHLGYTSDSIWHWRWPKKTINMVNIDGMEWKRSKYNKPTRRFLKFAEALAAKNAQVLIADSPQMQNHFWTTYNKKPVYIPYGAEIFTQTDDTIPGSYQLEPHRYFLLVARMEPENNIDMILRGYLDSSQAYPLLVIGNIANKFGKHINAAYNHHAIQFAGSIYDQRILNNLRYYSARYFHGHSVGGTNPSLLEAMACRCNIAAHNNVFNKTVLQNGADYFSDAGEVASIINTPVNGMATTQRKQFNVERIKTIYNIQKNIDDYERVMLQACSEKTLVLEPSPLGSL